MRGAARALLLGVALFAQGAACGNASAPARGEHGVLFIGNSFTYVNDLPGTVARLARAGGESLYTGAVALPNYALIDHTDHPSAAQATIRRGGWQFVVLQQGPTWPGLCQDTLVLAAQRLNVPIRAVGARPVLLMTWPSVGKLPAMDGVRASYETAAAAVGGLFVPAGEAWGIALAADPTLALYADDQFHPAPLGTLLTALVLYERLTGNDARALPANAVTSAVQGASVSLATATLLANAAHEANARFPAEPTEPATPEPGTPLVPFIC